MSRYTLKNIEDWDFRGYVSPIGRGPDGSVAPNPDATINLDPDADLFLSQNFTTILVIDRDRLSTLAILLKKGFATLSEDKADVLLDQSGADVLRYMTSSRDVFTSYGRMHRRVVKALVREWEKNGRVRSTILPVDMRQQFPGLFSEA